MNEMMYNHTINTLKSVLVDENCEKMNRSTIKGYIGELLVKQKLESENIGVIEHKGNQSKYDLLIPEKDIRIDVKLSLYKSEIKKKVELKNWGWALQFKRSLDKKKKVKCTHYVCVALDDKLEVKAYYVIQEKKLNKFRRTQIPQFRNVIRGFIVTDHSMKRHIPNELKDYFEYCDSLLKNNTVIRVGPAERLSKCL